VAQLGQQFLKKFPQSPLVADVQFMNARAAYAQGNYPASKTLFTRFVETSSHHERVNEARYGLALSTYKLGQIDASGSVMTTVKKELLPPQDQFFAYFLAGKLASMQGRTMESVMDYLAAYDRAAEESSRRTLREHVMRAIDGTMSIEDLQRLRSERAGKFPDQEIVAKLTARSAPPPTRGLVPPPAQGGETSETPVASPSPDVPPPSEVAELLKGGPVDVRSIGVILPLSGDAAPFGLSALNGIQYAAQVFGQMGQSKLPPVRLIIRDSKGSPDVAKEAYRELVDQQRVVAVVGPLMSRDTDFIADLARQRRVPTVVLSQKTGGSVASEYLFRPSMTLRLQAQTVAREAVERLGLKKFGILYPRDAYGIELATEFWKEVEARGGVVTAVDSYKPGETDFRAQVKRMTGTYYVQARKEEFQKLLQYIKDENNGKGPRRERDVELPPVIGFEGLFIPDGYKAVGQIAHHLDYFDVTNVTLLGSHAWHSDQLVSRAWPYVEGALFVDGFCPESTNSVVSTFVQGFQGAFRRVPDIHAAQGYDSLRLLLTATVQFGVSSREDLRKALESIRDYEGPSGKILKFDSAGEAEKRLCVLSARDKTIVELR
jgi:ABC-type branched-subunit amino acid transport system substrate-binding protein